MKRKSKRISKPAAARKAAAKLAHAERKGPTLLIVGPSGALKRIEQLMPSSASFDKQIGTIMKKAAEEQIKIGRPSRAGAATTPRNIRVTDAEWAAWRKHAKKVKARNVSEWIRELCNGAAGEER